MEIFILLFLGSFSLRYASSFTVSLNNYKILRKNESYILHFPLMENEKMQYILDFNMNIEAIRCINEISNSILNFRYRNDNKAIAESDIVGSKETEGKWNCELWMEKQCRLKYSFMVAVKYLNLNISLTNSDDVVTIINNSEIIMRPTDNIFQVQFRSNNPISEAWCKNDRKNEFLNLTAGHPLASNIYFHMRSKDKIRGQWNCTFKDTYGARKRFELKVIWLKPILRSSPISTSFRTTTENTKTQRHGLKDFVSKTKILKKSTTTSVTLQPSNIIRTITGSKYFSDNKREIPDLPSSSTGPPIALTKSTTEAATNKHNTDTHVQWWKAVVGAVSASLLILSSIIGIYVYRRKKKTSMAPQSGDSAPQPDPPSYNERVYYTLYDDDENYYSYAYSNPKPTDSNAAAKALYNIVNYYSYAYCKPKPMDSMAAANELYNIVNNDE